MTSNGNLVTAGNLGLRGAIFQYDDNYEIDPYILPNGVQYVNQGSSLAGVQQTVTDSAGTLTLNDITATTSLVDKSSLVTYPKSIALQSLTTQAMPTGQPTPQPSAQPSLLPSGQPSAQPTTQPSAQPSRQPTVQPSSRPSDRPRSWPTRMPSGQPSTHPTLRPSRKPSAQPTTQPSAQPSRQSTVQPSSRPSVRPSTHPTRMPSGQPQRLSNNQVKLTHGELSAIVLCVVFLAALAPLVLKKNRSWLKQKTQDFCSSETKPRFNQILPDLTELEDGKMTQDMNGLSADNGFNRGRRDSLLMLLAELYIAVRKSESKKSSVFPENPVLIEDALSTMVNSINSSNTTTPEKAPENELTLDLRDERSSFEMEQTILEQEKKNEG